VLFVLFEHVKNNHQKMMDVAHGMLQLRLEDQAVNLMTLTQQYAKKLFLEGFLSAEEFRVLSDMYLDKLPGR
jgi:hypothetical protein